MAIVEFIDVGKREDPNFEAIRGFVPKDLARRFKGVCAVLGLEHGDALAPLLEAWVAQKEAELAQERKNLSNSP
ncbi:hypothetical protein ACN4EK_24230 [Pantanalinema rosaneae CENA516]|uniref:hypothetical protein n=1 Tax=Pantanalinema rosaneae TaxID=1620701 RepID=UPI003D6E2468